MDINEDCGKLWRINANRRSSLHALFLKEKIKLFDSRSKLEGEAKEFIRKIVERKNIILPETDYETISPCSEKNENL